MSESTVSNSSAAAAAAASFAASAASDEDKAVKAFGANPHPYHAPPRPKDDEEERAPLDLYMVEETKSVYDNLALSFPAAMGKSTSRKERKSKGLLAPHLAYSEIEYMSLGLTLEKIKKYFGGLETSGGVFYDLGSGLGKAVCAAAILHGFDKCVGVEVLEGLHEAALDVADKFERKVKPTLGGHPPEVQFILGDILEMDWADATVIFANASCYSAALMATIVQRSSPLPEGTFFITVSKKLPSDAWKVLDSELLEMNWGMGTVFIHQKVTGAPMDDEDSGEETGASDSEL